MKKGRGLKTSALFTHPGHNVCEHEEVIKKASQLNKILIFTISIITNYKGYNF